MTDDDMTLAEARAIVEAHKKGKGGHCPCCGKWCKNNPIKLNSAVAMALINFWKHRNIGLGEGWVNYTDTLKASILSEKAMAGTYGSGKYWGLLEAKPNVDDPSKNKKGLWRLTPKGRLFVRGKIAVPHIAWVYRDEVIEFGGPEVFIKDCLASRFNYAEIMAMPGCAPNVHDDAIDEGKL